MRAQKSGNGFFKFQASWSFEFLSRLFFSEPTMIELDVFQVFYQLLLDLTEKASV